MIISQKEYIKVHHPNWPELRDNPYKILSVGCSKSGKANALLNLINNIPDIGKIYLYDKDPYESIYKILSNKGEDTGLTYLNDSKAFIE